MTYVRDDRPTEKDTAPAVWFAYSEDRKVEDQRKHLKNFKGALQADAYAGFHYLSDAGDKQKNQHIREYAENECLRSGTRLLIERLDIFETATPS